MCDLPYGTTNCRWDVVIPFEPLWKQYERIIKDNGAVVLTASQPFTTDLINSNRKHFRYEWIWDKKMVTGIGLAKVMPMKSHENILIFYKSKPNYNPQYREVKTPFGKLSLTQSDSIGFKADSFKVGVGYPKSIVEFPRPNNLSGGGLHPTQKPVALFEYLIKTYTNEGETVMDNCSGSGTTAIACIRTNRNFICMEKELKYYELSKERVKKELSQTKLKLAV